MTQVKVASHSKELCDTGGEKGSGSTGPCDECGLHSENNVIFFGGF